VNNQNESTVGSQSATASNCSPFLLYENCSDSGLKINGTDTTECAQCHCTTVSLQTNHNFSNSVCCYSPLGHVYCLSLMQPWQLISRLTEVIYFHFKNLTIPCSRRTCSYSLYVGMKGSNNNLSQSRKNLAPMHTHKQLQDITYCSKIVSTKLSDRLGSPGHQ